MQLLDGSEIDEREVAQLISRAYNDKADTALITLFRVFLTFLQHQEEQKKKFWPEHLKEMKP